MVGLVFEGVGHYTREKDDTDILFWEMVVPGATWISVPLLLRVHFNIVKMHEILL